MPNPFEPPKSSPLTATPLQRHPEFLPPSSFSSAEWPTWSSIEPSIQALIANTHTTTTTSTTQTNSTQTHPTSSIHRQTVSINDKTTVLRKRGLSKTAEGQQQDAAALLLGEEFGVNEVVEALRGKVEVERVVGRLMEWRRVNQSVGMRQGVGDGMDGADGKGDVGGADGKGDVDGEVGTKAV